MAETRSTWRVYVKQWLLDSRHADEASAAAYAHETYNERLTAEEFKIEPDDLDGKTWVVWTHRWGTVAEWKYEDATREWAQVWAKDFDIPPENIKVVERNSRSEHELLQHGVLKLAGQ